MMRRTSSVLAAFYVLSCFSARGSSKEQLPQILRYEEPSGHDFVSLKRVRRASEARKVFGPRDDNDEDDKSPMTWTVPPEIAVQNDTVDHQYYVMHTITNSEEELKKHWVDVDRLLEKPGVVGNRSHPLLYKSYRRAVGTKITFPFPFYGHRMTNLTIATGGFIYIGDQTHNWLAATQYIAPLMANFHTYLNNSNIIYVDDGKMFVVEWRRVQLREEAQNNTFSFQVILHKNGDIVFAYKDVPMDVANISDANHPVKLGISDAYLFQHPADAHGMGQPKRVIYEYHRVEVPLTKVTSNSVVILEAQPTCILIDNCEQCSNATLKHFNCTWCHSKKKNGGPFCTDDAGLHRRRQHWVEGNCKDRSRSLYCDGKDEDEVDDDDKSGSSESGSPSQPDVVVLPDASSKNKASASSGSAYAFSVIMLLLVFLFVGWLAYAYYYPHTTSGQMLIKYRPSRWHVPSSHVRYSASVHM
ncbi:unnamed protein product [Caenorhabditis auriculariae]|uniref:Uncharacterized protein n=1 Tax=Caenorhabditis auriculariae TaxID=2777116 RepID=A0A8S1HW86_9PELO|nr:unnamed protein product [Caenorhabditis auriculariae]